MAQLRVTSPVLNGQTFNLEGEYFTIGRDADNTICLTHQSISKHHAMLTVDKGDFKLWDLHSTNGIIVNGQKTVLGHLKDGDRITLGDIEVQFLSNGLAQSEKPAPQTETQRIVLPWASVTPPVVTPPKPVAEIKPTLAPLPPSPPPPKPESKPATPAAPPPTASASKVETKEIVVPPLPAPAPKISVSKEPHPRAPVAAVLTPPASPQKADQPQLPQTKPHEPEPDKPLIQAPAPTKEPPPPASKVRTSAGRNMLYVTMLVGGLVSLMMGYGFNITACKFIGFIFAITGCICLTFVVRFHGIVAPPR